MGVVLGQCVFQIEELMAAGGGTGRLTSAHRLRAGLRCGRIELLANRFVERAWPGELRPYWYTSVNHGNQRPT
jgi:hypothetical protein